MTDSGKNEFIGENSSDAVLPDFLTEVPDFAITPAEETFEPLPASPDEKRDRSTDYFGNYDSDLFDEATLRISDYNSVPNLKYVTLGARITSIEDGFFDYYKNLERIDVCEGNKKFSSKFGVLFDRRKKILLRYPPMKPDRLYLIPEGVEVIDRHAFFGVEQLRGLIFPKSLKSVSSEAFVDCPYIGVPVFMPGGGVEQITDRELAEIRRSLL